MEKYTQLVIMLPCHSLEDFPLHHEGEDAQGLLANWSAMFHPALVHSAGAMPAWARVDDPPEELAGRLLLIPSVSTSEVPAGFPARAKDEGAVVIREQSDRREIIEQALAGIDSAGNQGVSELVPDFLALGYCFLQVQLLTRQMRYASNLDEVYFGNQLVAAAGAWHDADQTKARELLQSCFDVLGEERDHFYPVDAMLMDLTLVADTTIGQSLRDELNRAAPVNVMLSGETLAAMAEKEPQSLDAVKAAIAGSRLSLVGGDFQEGPASLFDHETMLAELRRGLSAYEEHLGTRPTIYGRRRFGLAPWMPQVLKKMGFTAAIHATFDGGSFPNGSQTKTMWEGHDGSEINALARPPQDATRPDTFLHFCMNMRESLDSDTPATVHFAQRPGQACEWFDDLRRAASWGPALGKFVSLDEYFKEADHGGLTDRFEADSYRPPYLKQAVIREEANAISDIVRHYREAGERRACDALVTLASLLSGDAMKATSAEPAAPESAARLAGALPGKESSQPSYLITNPNSFVRRICAAADQMSSLPTVEKPVYAVGESHGQKHVVIDVPPMGFAWATPGDGGAAKGQKPLVDEGVLRNEFFEVRFDETTGAMKSMHDYKNRNNRMSQQIAFRSGAKRAGDERDDRYSVMAADGIEVTAADAAVGEITTRGRLLDREGTELAGYVQRFRATRGSRVLQIEVDLDPKQQPRADAWNSYYACRFAWGDESANLYRTVGGVREATHARRFEAPLYIDLDVPKQRTAILTGGLAYPRRVGMRMLDTLLAVRGEGATTFRLGIGLDLTHPMQEALSFLTPAAEVFQEGRGPQGPASGWLFHLDSKNVIATHWQPLVTEGNVTGFSVRLLEVYGRAAAVTLSAFRDVKEAKKVDLLGEPISDCKVSGDKIELEMSPKEFAALEIRL